MFTLRQLPGLDLVPGVQSGRSGMLPQPGWVQKWKLSLKDVVIAVYLPRDWVCVLVFSPPSAGSWHV